MTISRVFQEVPLSINAMIELDQSASHHLARVLRAKEGEKIILFNGQGGEYAGVIAQIAKKSVIVHIEKFFSRDVESPLELCLVQGISRGEKMDYVIQKAVELGVKKIIPILTERCTVKLDEERRATRWQHWRSIVISACEQCGRTQIPELSIPITLADWLQKKLFKDFAFVLDPEAKTKLNKIPVEFKGQVVLLIGPEGGLTQDEIKLACRDGYTALNLGPRILRTETAAVTALAMFQALFGDLVI